MELLENEGIYRFRNPLFLFNDPTLERPQGPERNLIFLTPSVSQWKLAISLQLHGSKAVSQSNMPFGGVDYKGKTPSQVELTVFFEELFSALKKEGVSNLSIILPPEIYDSILFSMQLTCLLNLNFKIRAEGLNYHLDIGPSFETHLHHSLNRKLKKVISENWHWERGGVKDLKEFFEFSLRCRAKKEIPLNADLDLLRSQFSSHPNNFDLFLVRKNGSLAAAGIGVKVCNNIYYIFLPSTDPDLNSYSPMVFLTSLLYNQARGHNCTVLDLGIAAPIGTPINVGLETFKKRLGGQLSRKCILDMTL